MRVGLFTDAYLPDINGVVSSVATLKEALEGKGHTVFVISNHKSNKISMSDDNVLRLPGIELKKFYGYKMSSPIQLRGEDYIRNMHLDVIHVQTEAGIGMFGRQMARVLSIPLIYTYHTMYEDYTHYINPLDFETVERFGKFAIRSFSRYLGNGAQAVIAPSTKTKDALIRYGVHTPIYVVPTGLDLSQFDRHRLESEKLQTIRNRYNITDEDHTVVFVGRIAKEKMIEIPIHAMALTKDPHLKLIVVGSGTDENYYHKMVKDLHLEDKVIFTGKVAKEEVPYYYAAFDCFVSASTTETQGMTYIESLASGLVVFGRRDEVLQDLIDEGITGYYFDDEYELVQKWNQFFKKEKDERQVLEGACRQKTESYTVSMFGSRMLQVYKEAIEEYKQSYTIDKIRMSDDFVQLTVVRDSDKEEVKISVPLDDFFEYKIALHTKMDASLVQNYQDMQPIYHAFKAMKRRVLSNDYTSYEVQLYCRRHFDLDEYQSKAISMALEERGLLDDKQYALDKAELWQSHGQPKIAIERKLRKVGINGEYIDLAVGQLNEEEELDHALRLANRLKNGVKEQSNRLKRQNIVKKLVNKGFTLDIAKEASNQIEWDEDESQALKAAFSKAKRLYASIDEPKRMEKIRAYCMRKGFGISQIDEIIEGESDD